MALLDENIVKQLKGFFDIDTKSEKAVAIIASI